MNEAEVETCSCTFACPVGRLIRGLKIQID
jgi:hypothetical protein